MGEVMGKELDVNKEMDERFCEKRNEKLVVRI